MAVQKSKKSRSKRDHRRSSLKIKDELLSVEYKSGEKHIRHHISPKGYYRGKKIELFKGKNKNKK